METSDFLSHRSSIRENLHFMNSYKRVDSKHIRNGSKQRYPHFDKAEFQGGYAPPPLARSWCLSYGLLHLIRAGVAKNQWLVDLSSPAIVIAVGPSHLSIL